ncbi:MAG: lysophospholipid acyltransferase family protein [Gammaproteobacteria bacterium]|nr:lysophospholipid acyltransferase family protein [Gammaproteobacteria bacterium]
MRFPELSYANPNDPLWKQQLVHWIENFSGRDDYVDAYERWKHNSFGRSAHVFADMLKEIQVDLQLSGQMPEQIAQSEKLVIVANHPFGIGDGIAILSLAERFGRPFRILINKDLLKIPEMREYALPVSFDEDKSALKLNAQTARNAVERLNNGEIIVIFPSGGVATSPNGFGKAEDLPWKTFTAKMIQSARADVLPVYFEGQNGRLFQLVSQFSITLRLALLVHEFCNLRGKGIKAWVGGVIPWDTLAAQGDRRELTQYLHQQVFDLKG